MNATTLGWDEILPQPFVCLILGERGSGKTALGHRLLEHVHEHGEDGRDAYILGFPEEKADLLPDWVEVLPPTVTRDTWPENSVVLIHEAHQVIHARRALDAENLVLDELVTVSRHKDSDIIYDTQQSQRLDKNAVASVDGIIVRWPALMQEQFERRAVRPIIEDARDTLSKYVNIIDEDDYTYVEHREDDDGVDLLNKHAYIHADKFRGEYPHEITLADHWTEAISKAYGDGGPDGSDTANYGRKPKTLDDIRGDMAEPDELDDRDPNEIEELIGGDTTGSDDEDDPDPVENDAPADTTDADAGIDAGSADPDDDGEPEISEADAIDAARQYIGQLIENDTRVVQNNFPTPGVSIIVPNDIADETEDLISEYDLNPQGPSPFPQSPPPTLEGQDAAAAEGLTSFQFTVDEASDPQSSGYDLDAIFTAMEDEPAIVTRSPAIAFDPF